MSRPLMLKERLALAARPVNVPQTITAPVKGWNTRDALDEMDPLDAITLDNWYPDASGVNSRNGYQSYVSGLAGTVKTLAEYRAGSTHKFLAAGGGHIYDIANASVTSLASGFTSDAWQTVHFLAHTFFANGADTMQDFNGSAIGNSTFTGVTLSTLYGGAIYQNRLFFWQQNSTGFYYAPLNSVTGTLTFFDLSAFSPNGGNLVAAITFSHDGSNGVLDYICFIMSSGDCLIYWGNDPSNANFWQLIGVYRVAPPVSPRAVCNYGADAFVTTFDDHMPLQQQLAALRAGELPPRSKVSTAVQQAVAANLSGFGWQALYYPAGRRLIFNIPNTDGTFSQHVCNTGVPAQPWCRFTNMNAYCWGLFGNSLYFGAAGGIVYHADTGSLDVMGAIACDGQQSWNMLGNLGRKKVGTVRPILKCLGNATYDFQLAFDYETAGITVSGVTASNGSPWNTSPWNTSSWSLDYQIDARWRVGGGAGQSVSALLSVAAVQPVTWLRTDMRLESGTEL